MTRASQPQVAAMATITGVGRGAIRRLARVTAMASITAAPLSSRTAAADRSLEAPSPRSPRWDNPIPSLVSHAGKGAAVVRGLVPTRRGSEESGTNPPFWPEGCATRLQHAAPFGSWLHGPGVDLQRATAMKPWKMSSATNETRSACFSFRLDPQWSGYGPVLPQGTSRKPETGRTPRSRKNQKPSLTPPFSEVRRPEVFRIFGSFLIFGGRSAEMDIRIDRSGEVGRLRRRTSGDIPARVSRDGCSHIRPRIGRRIAWVPVN
jgi:hypothetical protein